MKWKIEDSGVLNLEIESQLVGDGAHGLPSPNGLGQPFTCYHLYSNDETIERYTSLSAAKRAANQLIRKLKKSPMPNSAIIKHENKVGHQFPSLFCMTAYHGHTQIGSMALGYVGQEPDYTEFAQRMCAEIEKRTGRKTIAFMNGYYQEND